MAVGCGPACSERRSWRFRRWSDFGRPRRINGTPPDPEFGGPGACDGVARPAVEMQAHSAPLGLTFYTGSQFPAEYRGDLFVDVRVGADGSLYLSDDKTGQIYRISYVG